MNILLIGSGGREHALAWKLAQSPECDTLYAAPGNPGIAEEATLVALDVADHAAVIAFCAEKHIGLVVVGPEAPLVDGLGDSLRAKGIPVFGPNAKAAQLEGSKGFTKDLCTRANIPTAGYARHTDKVAALADLARFGLPVVIKADGLAAGKGVIIAETEADARAAIEDMFGGGFGDAGAEVVLEEFMTGEEASFFALSDGKDVIAFGSAQDHKRVGDGDVGGWGGDAGEGFAVEWVVGCGEVEVVGVAASSDVDVGLGAGGRGVDSTGGDRSGGALHGVAGERVGVVDADLDSAGGSAVVVEEAAGQLDGADAVEVDGDPIRLRSLRVVASGGDGAEGAVADIGVAVAVDVEGPVGGAGGDAVAGGEAASSAGGDLVVAEFAVHMQRQVNEAREIADLIQASGWEHSVVDRTVTVKDPTGVLAARLWKDFHTRNGHANGKN